MSVSSSAIGGGRHARRVHCRIYTNWWTVDPVTGCYNTAIRARVAAKVRVPHAPRSAPLGFALIDVWSPFAPPRQVTPDGTRNAAGAGAHRQHNRSKQHHRHSIDGGAADPYLDVIELPPAVGAKHQPSQIACCQVSGNVAVATVGGAVRLWRLRVRTGGGGGQRPYIDFRPAGRWRLSVPFACERLQLAENWLVAASDEFVAIVQLQEHRRRRRQRMRLSRQRLDGAHASDADWEDDGDDEYLSE